MSYLIVQPNSSPVTKFVPKSYKYPFYLLSNVRTIVEYYLEVDVSYPTFNYYNF